MDVIRLFLDNIFAAYQRTDEMLKVKKDIYSGMEDKYNELIAAGKSEHEVIGILISDFGNIEELIKEMNLGPAGQKADHIICIDECEEYIKDKKTGSAMIAAGVFLCIMAPSSMCLSSIFRIRESFMLLPFFLHIAAGVSLFILSGKYTDKHKFIKENYILDYRIKDYISFRMKAFRRIYPFFITIGTVLCIFSPLSVIMPAELFRNRFTGEAGIFIFFLMIAVAVFIFIVSGSILDIYKRLLQEEEYSIKKAEIV